MEDELRDEHQRSAEPAYRLPATCWRCEAAAPETAVGLCGACLRAMRSSDHVRSDPAPELDVRRPLAEVLADFGRAVQGPDLVRCSFVHDDDDLQCESVMIGTSRFELDSPVVLERGRSYCLVIDDETGSARIEQSSQCEPHGA